MTTFRAIRVAAWEALYSKTWSDGYPLYCSMQDRHEDLHVGVYCNALSHVEALQEFLYNAAWCDEITMEGIQDDEPTSERLLRFYGTTFLLMAECYEDLKDIADTIDHSTKRGPFDPVNGFINTVVKHRREPKGMGGFHSSNHHGPYFFRDDPSLGQQVSARATSPGNYDDLKAGVMTSLLVPSLVESAGSLADEVVAISSATESADAIAKLDARYGYPLDGGQQAAR